MVDEHACVLPSAAASRHRRGGFCRAQVSDSGGFCGRQHSVRISTGAAAVADGQPLQLRGHPVGGGGALARACTRNAALRRRSAEMAAAQRRLRSVQRALRPSGGGPPTCSLPAAAAAVVVDVSLRPVLDLGSLRVTQIHLRNDAQMTGLIEHIASGGNMLELEGDVPQVVRFEDGEIFLRDGHHRCVASLAAGRTELMPTEYELEEWEYSAWAAPNFETGFITPYDPRTAIRLHDLTDHREAVAAALRDSGAAAAAEYIATHPEGYLAVGGRVGRDTVSDLLDNWMRQGIDATQGWVDDCVAWTAAWQKAISPSAADSSAQAAAKAVSAPPAPHFPVGWRSSKQLSPVVDLHADALRTPSALSAAAERYNEVRPFSCAHHSSGAVHRRRLRHACWRLAGGLLGDQRFAEH